METLTVVLLILGSNVVVVLVTAYINQRGARADTRETNAKAAQIESKTEQDETTFYRAQGRETATQVRVLEAEIKGLREAMKIAEAQSEQRAGSLYARIGDLAVSLEKANATIAELRLEVKNLNETITKLLVEQEKGKG